MFLMAVFRDVSTLGKGCTDWALTSSVQMCLLPSTSTLLFFRHELVVQTNGFHYDISMPDLIIFTTLFYPPLHLAKFLFYFIFWLKSYSFPRQLFPREAGSQWHICYFSIWCVQGLKVCLPPPHLPGQNLYSIGKITFWLFYKYSQLLQPSERRAVAHGRFKSSRNSRPEDLRVSSVFHP